MTCKSVDVHSYSNELDVLTNIPIATAGTVSTQPVFRDRLKHSLICPNQLKSHGVVVNDVPVQFDKSIRHAIVHEEVTISLEMAGVVSYFESRLPRSDEIESLAQPSGQTGILSLTTTRVTPGPLLRTWVDTVSLAELLDDTELSKRVIACVRVSASFPSCSIITENGTDQSSENQNASVATVSSGERK
jgi:hypothetical protein